MLVPSCTTPYHSQWIEQLHEPACHLVPIPTQKARSEPETETALLIIVAGWLKMAQDGGKLGFSRWP